MVNLGIWSVVLLAVVRRHSIDDGRIGKAEADRRMEARLTSPRPRNLMLERVREPLPLL